SAQRSLINYIYICFFIIILINCCVQTSRIPLSILQEVEKVEVQSRHGACEIDALVLHHNGKKYCAKPRAKKVLETLRHIKLGTQHMA
uniref:Chemokine interleukin-8-like domain-containing protein n=1 Tax=Astyanax mexicanus TaxID=7994 RepID=A0A3B1ISS3_ASTMX